MNERDLLNAGFQQIGEFALIEGNVVIRLDEPAADRKAVYALMDGEDIAYIGVAMMPLAKRLYFYAKPGVSQETSLRVNALIRAGLTEGRSIRIIATYPGRQTWNGLALDVAPGLETALIEFLQPKWNKKGRNKTKTNRISTKQRVNFPEPQSENNRNHAYWVYVNDGRKRGAVHRAECSHCNFGKGKFGGGRRPNGYWKSFRLRKDAYAFADSVGYSDITACSTCGG